MCYPKPGPRCSAHASLALLQAKSAYDSYKGGIFEEHWALKEKLEAAQDDFYITPLGLKVLEEELLRDKHDPYLQQKLKKYRELRAEKMAALKAGAVEIKHDTSDAPNSHEDVEFLDATTNRPRIPDDVLFKEDYMASKPWVSSLSEEEIEQIRWMSDYGAMETNTHIAGTNNYKLFNGRFPPEDIEKRMKLVDSALAKYETEMPIITYRGVRKGVLPQTVQDNFWYLSSDQRVEEVLKLFPKGEVVMNKYYWPTSTAPDKASMFADCDVVLEIKTRKAAPIAPLSAVAREHERLLPRNSSYKVVAVLKDVMYGKVSRTVIQLEEISHP